MTCVSHVNVNVDAFNVCHIHINVAFDVVLSWGLLIM